MREYTRRNTVAAAKITNISLVVGTEGEDNFVGDSVLEFGDSESVRMERKWMVHNQPQVGDYLIRQPTGEYTKMSEAAFEALHEAVDV